MDRNFIEALGVVSENPAVCTGQEWAATRTTEQVSSFSPVDASLIAKVSLANTHHYNEVVGKATRAFAVWRRLPAPQRGEFVRRIGNRLRERKEELGTLVSYEMGKSLQEGYGEVQEMIDICDFAVGLSRQLYGRTMHSERPEHRMYEQWHPLGVVGIISAFNFPVAVWAWNAMIAAVCGNVSIWKPSEKTPLTAIACMRIVGEVIREEGLCEGIISLVQGKGSDIGEAMAADKRIALLSATGSVQMGRRVATVVGARLGKSLLELGGNNAVIVTPSANLELAIPAIMFGAVGTAGQRCTSIRRVICHAENYDKFRDALVAAYGALRVGNPLDAKYHVGPLIDKSAVDRMQEALSIAKEQGAKVLCGGEVLTGEEFRSQCWVRPALLEVTADISIMQEETFAPLLYLVRYKGDLSKAIDIQNSVPQGLSSALFSNSLHEVESYLSAWGSDCGIANINIATSGAEIGGAFGGEKDTGGGRESGSDAWKGYMRRQTNTINFGNALPLAQGIEFTIN